MYWKGGGSLSDWDLLTQAMGKGFLKWQRNYNNFWNIKGSISLND